MSEYSILWTPRPPSPGGRPFVSSPQHNKQTFIILTITRYESPASYLYVCRSSCWCDYDFLDENGINYSCCLFRSAELVTKCWSHDNKLIAKRTSERDGDWRWKRERWYNMFGVNEINFLKLLNKFPSPNSHICATPTPRLSLLPVDRLSLCMTVMKNKCAYVCSLSLSWNHFFCCTHTWYFRQIFV